MRQGNATHNGFQPYRLDDGNFALRWTKSFSQSIQPIATGDNHVFVSHGSGNASLTSLIPTLLLKKSYADRFEIGVTEEALDLLRAHAYSTEQTLAHVATDVVSGDLRPVVD